MVVALIYIILLYEQYVEWREDKTVATMYSVMLLEGSFIFLYLASQGYSKKWEFIIFGILLFRMSCPVIIDQIKHICRRSVLSFVFAFIGLLTGVFLVVRTCYCLARF